jgi:hypothetical protein
MLIHHHRLFMALLMASVVCGRAPRSIGAQDAALADGSRPPRFPLARHAAPPPPPLVGTIAGRVTDATSGQPVPLAQVSVVGTAFGRTTDDSGRYAITGVPVGDHELNVRRVGYAPLTRRVQVTDGGTATADFALARAPTSLAEVVTTVTGQQERY